MNAAALLSDLAGQGFALSIDDDRLIVSPSSRLSENARAKIREHKAEILALLAANDAEHPVPEPLPVHRMFSVIQPDGTVLSVTRCPPATLAEIQADYPGCTVEVEPDPPPAPPLSGEDRKIADALLRHWQEDEPIAVTEWLEGLARDPERLRQMHEQALALGLARWEDMPATEQAEIPRQMAVCARCRHFEPDPINPIGGMGKCLADAPASHKPGSCWPWPEAEIRCNQYNAARPPQTERSTT
ncbi:hypothetical protein [uncultured Thiocystis sp.]|jgi:hypothetical protein|uniref:TubC N-terminal docking domain-related protein n=1 Tax=uncultured Thiocystis sp. TaxID=1202134 RepID=UPI0025FD646A|nr:hypothetical protein [uncultured Thiocystis sp.]